MKISPLQIIFILSLCTLSLAGYLGGGEEYGGGLELHGYGGGGFEGGHGGGYEGGHGGGYDGGHADSYVSNQL